MSDQGGGSGGVSRCDSVVRKNRAGDPGPSGAGRACGAVRERELAPAPSLWSWCLCGEPSFQAPAVPLGRHPRHHPSAYCLLSTPVPPLFIAAWDPTCYPPKSRRVGRRAIRVPLSPAPTPRPRRAPLSREAGVWQGRRPPPTPPPGPGGAGGPGSPARGAGSPDRRPPRQHAGAGRRGGHPRGRWRSSPRRAACGSRGWRTGARR